MMRIIVCCGLLGISNVIYSSMEDKVTLPNQVELKARIDRIFLSEGPTSCQFDEVTELSARLNNQQEVTKVGDVLAAITLSFMQYEAILEAKKLFITHPEVVNTIVAWTYSCKEPLIEAVLQEYPKVKILVRNMEAMGAFHVINKQ